MSYTGTSRGPMYLSLNTQVASWLTSVVLGKLVVIIIIIIIIIIIKRILISRQSIVVL